MVYLFDTDVVSELMEPAPAPHLTARVARLPSGDICTTSITIGEIVYGAARKQRPGLVDDLASRFADVTVLPFDAPAAFVYGEIRADLERAGRRLNEPDLRIASIALAHGLTVVTGNRKHFERVPGLVVEDWLR